MLKFSISPTFWRFDPRSWTSRLAFRYVLVAFLLITTTLFLYTGWINSTELATLRIKGSQKLSPNHPIKTLMREAISHHQDLLAKRSYDVSTAAAQYRSRRGRHPPPGFDRWVEAALEADALIVEDYFDRIYKDITPFWAMHPHEINTRAQDWPWVIAVRNGSARAVGDIGDRVPWLHIWTGAVREIAPHLPDVDMPINQMDEPRLLVPFDNIAAMVELEEKERTIPVPDEVTDVFKGLSEIDTLNSAPHETEWYDLSTSYWDLAVRTCGPDTPAYGVSALTNFSEPVELPSTASAIYSYKGHVKNWTASMDPCLQPHLRGMHGTFIEPISLSTSDELFPLFGGSKLPMNNEILIPGAMYLADKEMYSGGKDHGPLWPKKKDGLVWRGDGTGGRPKEHTWHRFQRHRLIKMLNWTEVSLAEANDGRSKLFDIPSPWTFNSLRTLRKGLGAWLRGFADVGFIHLCTGEGECDFLLDEYATAEPKPMKEQFKYKFLPDADGNSFSARFRGFLRSTSVPLKATIYTEWHDDRLVPWLHFIPLDNTFRDLYAVLEFFGDGQDGGEGDDAARFIAETGKDWAEQVLRREDMKLYIWRLLLEWARVCDENRSTLGYVGDLL